MKNSLRLLYVISYPCKPRRSEARNLVRYREKQFFDTLYVCFILFKAICTKHVVKNQKNYAIVLKQHEFNRLKMENHIPA